MSRLSFALHPRAPAPAAAGSRMRRGVLRYVPWTLATVVDDACALETPLFMLPTSRGVVPHIPEDLLADCERALRHVALGDVIDWDAATLQRSAGGLPSLLHPGGPLLLDVLVDKRFAAPQQAAADDAAVRITGYHAPRQLRYSEFWSAIAPMGVHAVVFPFEECGASTGKKRGQRAPQRTLSIARQLLQARAAAAVSDSRVASVMSIAAAVGRTAGERAQAARDLAALAAESPGLGGCVVRGLFDGESPAQRSELLQASLDPLPEELLRIVQVPSLTDALQCIVDGVDVVTSWAPFDLAARGLVLNLAPCWRELEASTAVGSGSATASSDAAAEQAGERALLLDVRDPRLALDGRPLTQDCMCFACRRYTRAYVHHLCNTNEMLGQTLVALCNVWQTQQLFRRVRGALDDQQPWRVQRMLDTLRHGAGGVPPQQREAA